jgi:acyl phosphate:glycerol-3-phosphate acyltransferase
VGVTGADLLVLIAAAALGYVIGSLPLSALVGRAAGVDASDGGGPSLHVAGVWALAGPGWGLLALVADLARGILPVTLAVATFAWPAGWAAGMGAILGARWPVLGQLRGGNGAWVVAGVLVALEPTAAVVASLIALAAAAAARLAGRRWRSAAVRAALVAYPVLALLTELSPVRLAAVLALYLVAALAGTMPRR